MKNLLPCTVMLYDEDMFMKHVESEMKDKIDEMKVNPDIDLDIGLYDNSEFYHEVECIIDLNKVVAAHEDWIKHAENVGEITQIILTGNRTLRIKLPYKHFIKRFT